MVFQDLPKVSPSSPFCVGAFASSMAYLISRSMYPVFVEISFVSFGSINQDNIIKRYY